MRRCGLLCAAFVVCVVQGLAAHADPPYFHARTSGSPVATVAGEWTHAATSARLDVRGVTSRAAPTTFDAGSTFPAVGTRCARCPVATMTVSTVTYAETMVDLRTELRWRRPGGRWTPWMRFGEGGIPRGPWLDDTPTSYATYTPPRSCTGPLEFAWRVRTTLNGEAALAALTFGLAVRPG